MTSSRQANSGILSEHSLPRYASSADGEVARFLAVILAVGQEGGRDLWVHVLSLPDTIVCLAVSLDHSGPSFIHLLIKGGNWVFDFFF